MAPNQLPGSSCAHTVTSRYHDRHRQSVVGLVSDDVLPVSLEGEQVQVAAGFPQIKLWPDSAT